MTTTGDLARAHQAIELHAREMLAAVGVVQPVGPAVDRVRASWEALDHQTRVAIQDLAPGFVAAIMRLP